VDAANRGRAFGLEGVGDNAGACVGPLLAIMLLMVYHLPIRVIFYLAVIPGLLAFLMVLFVEEKRTGPAMKSKMNIRLQPLPKAYWKYLLATSLFGLGNSSNAFLILETKDIGATLTTTILIYAGFNLVAALISYPAGSLSDRFGRRRLLAIAMAIFLVTYLGFAAARNVWFIGLFFLLYGLHQGVFRAVGKALASDYVSESRHATAIGWYNTSVGASGLLASLIAGWLWDHVGHTAVFFFGAAFAVMGIAALPVLIPATVVWVDGR
jgi:MFS family permease